MNLRHRSNRGKAFYKERDEAIKLIPEGWEQVGLTLTQEGDRFWDCTVHKFLLKIFVEDVSKAASNYYCVIREKSAYVEFDLDGSF